MGEGWQIRWGFSIWQPETKTNLGS